MIRSMTGYGSAESADGDTSYALELRSLNHRYLKLSIKLPDRLQFLEPTVDKILRQQLSRGSISLSVRARCQGSADAVSVNLPVMEAYLAKMSEIKAPSGMTLSVDLASLASLPGVCESPETDEEARTRRVALIEDLTKKSVDALMKMRDGEGEALRADILDCCGILRDKLAEIGKRSPQVVEEYHDRLRSRVDTLMKRGGFELEAEGLMREVAIYAERCDISEEVMRFGAHLEDRKSVV